MAKFIKFHISANVNTTIPSAAGGDWGGRDVLIGVDDIENIADLVAGGVYTAIVTLKAGFAGVQAGFTLAGGGDGTVPATTLAGRILTLTTLYDAAGTPTNPVAVTVGSNMPSQCINRALTANPGGVAASAQLGLDGGGVRGTDNQMYWSSAIFSTDVAI